MARGRAWIGTSGWSYRHWGDGAFFPAKLRTAEQLEYYATVFDCVELNSTFYHTPRETTVAGWVERTPEGFLFAYKGSRFITHMKKLLDVEDSLALTVGRARLLGRKLGPMLWQFAPRFARDLPRLEAFFELLPRDLRHGVEFRHKSWFADDTYSLLARYGVSLVWADTPRYPLEKVATADFLYLRLHGHEALYQSCYTEDELAGWAAEVVAAVEDSKDVYVFFDNDAQGFAARNALTLRGQVEEGLGLSR